jgi:hypothetical protein
MYLQDGTRSHFMKFVEREFPSMRPRFERLYVRKYPPETYRKEIQAMVRLLQQRHGLMGREDRRNANRKNEDTDPEGGREQEGTPGPEQVGFAW